MKLSKSLIASAVIALLPLAAIAGDKDKTPAPMGTVTSAQFAQLDANHDSRISREEAAMDSKIVFAAADKNGDGYLDGSEYLHRGTSSETMPNTGNPATDTEYPRK